MVERILGRHSGSEGASERGDHASARMRRRKRQPGAGGGGGGGWRGSRPSESPGRATPTPQCARLLLGKLQDVVLGGFPGSQRPAPRRALLSRLCPLVRRNEAAAPGRILSVRYEDVVDDLEGQTRRMLDFLGLEFEPQCLDFHLSTDPSQPPAASRSGSRSTAKGSARPSLTGNGWGRLIEELGPARVATAARPAPPPASSSLGSIPSALNVASQRSAVGVSNNISCRPSAANQPGRVISSSSWPSPQPA